MGAALRVFHSAGCSVEVVGGVRRAAWCRVLCE